jgi:uncharacterized protein YcbK (DUF882 family)
MTHSSVSRRRFLGMGFSVACSTLLLPKSVTGLLLPKKLFTGERKLNLYNMHTGEFFNEPYWVEGRYLPESLKAINVLFRDHRTQEVNPIKLGLVDLLYKLQHLLYDTKRLSKRNAFNLVSGFRSRSTNQLLRRRSQKVASRSLHMEGAAVDLQFRGLSLGYAHKAVCALKAGGVGYYPGRRDRFIHMDVREQVVKWVG